MPNALVNVNECPVCGSTSSASAGTHHSKPIVNIDAGFSVLPAIILVKYSLCLMCGMIWQNPRMSDEAIKRYYSEGHYRTSLMNTDESCPRVPAARSA